MKTTCNTILLSFFFIFLQVSAKKCPAPAQPLCVTEAADTAGKTCGAKGHVGHIKPSDPKLLHHCSMSSLEACRDSCLAAPACKSFRWRSNYRACSRYRVPLENLPFEADPKSTSVVYDSACYQAQLLQDAFQLIDTSDDENAGRYVTSNAFRSNQAVLVFTAHHPETFALDSSANLVSIGNDMFNGNILSMESDGSAPDQLFTFTASYDSQNGFYPVTCALGSSSPNLSCQNGEGTQFYSNGNLFGLGPPGSTDFAAISIQAVCPSSSATTDTKELVVASPRKPWL